MSRNHTSGWIGAIACSLLLASGCAGFGKRDQGAVAVNEAPTVTGVPPAVEQASYQSSAGNSSHGALPPPAETISTPDGSPLPGTSLSAGSLPGTSLPAPDEPEGFEKLDPANVKKSFMKAIGQGPDEIIARKAFREGEELFRKQQYKEAAKKFKGCVRRWPDSALEEDAMFMLAESYFFSDQYSRANDAYGELMKKHTNTRYLDKTVARVFAIGRYWEQEAIKHPHWPTTPNLFDRSKPVFDTRGHALASYDVVRLNDPRGPLADDSIMAAANMHFQSSRWEDADHYYGLLRKDYPKSEHQVQAHLLGLQCKLRKYQGPGYAGAPLEEAEELINQMLVQFPNELAGERERLLTSKKEVRAQRAYRDVELAQYYDKNEHYGAAKFYYAEVVKEYPNTPFATKSQERIAALGGLPDEPVNKIAFITDTFDSEKRKEAARKKAVAAKLQAGGTGTVLR